MMTNGRLRELSSRVLLVLHFMVLTACLVQLRLNNHAMVRIQENQVVILSGTVLAAETYNKASVEFIEWRGMVEDRLQQIEHEGK